MCNAEHHQNNYIDHTLHVFSFTKYGVDLITLNIQKNDFRFSTISRGTTPLEVGHADNCSGCSGYTTYNRSEIRFDIEGK